MSLSDSIFIFCFLPIALLLFYIAREELREYILVVFSLLFYAFGSRTYFLILLAATAVNIVLARLISRAKENALKTVLLVIGVIADVGLLSFYKFRLPANFIWEKLTGRLIFDTSLMLPLGISFFTFKAISMLADSYTGKAKLNKNPVHDALYLTFFAQITSGPLSRYNDLKNVSASLEKGFKRFDYISEGVYRFVIGIIKKLLIADNLGKITTEVFGADYASVSSAYLWLGSICFSLKLFYDFAGYSDMAIGITKMFGYDCPENFDYPYTTESVAGFWKRWHMSLSFWFRDYVYIPLGGSRNKTAFRTYVNLFVVWALTGIWHGASIHFVVWGLGYFVLISLERLTGLPAKLKNGFAKGLYRTFTLLCINFLWVMFNVTGFKQGVLFIKGMILPQSDELSLLRTGVLLKQYGVFIAVAVIFCMPVAKAVKTFIDKKNIKALTVVSECISFAVLAVLFILCVALSVSGQNSPFVYALF